MQTVVKLGKDLGSNPCLQVDEKMGKTDYLHPNPIHPMWGLNLLDLFLLDRQHRPHRLHQPFLDHLRVRGIDLF